MYYLKAASILAKPYLDIVFFEAMGKPPRNAVGYAWEGMRGECREAYLLVNHFGFMEAASLSLGFPLSLDSCYWELLGDHEDPRERERGDTLLSFKVGAISPTDNSEEAGFR